MPININGTTGISGVDGSAGTPAIQGTDANTGISFPAADTVAVNTGGAEALRVDASKRLLVGTSTARVILDWGTLRQQFEGTSYTDGLLVFNNANNIYPAVIALGKSRGTSVGSNTVVTSGDQLGEVAFYGADGTNVVRGAAIGAYVDATVTNNGNEMPSRLVFSTTADGASSPTERMRIANTGDSAIFSNNYPLTVATGQGAGTTYQLITGRHTAASTQTGTTVFVVQSNGNVANTNNSYGAYSDARLKENIVDATSQWSDIKALQVRKYNFKEGQTHTQIGLIAQEVELVSPGLVSESPDRDAEGNDLGTVTKSVNYSVLYMKAVKALQEAMERIEQLETSNADLLARVTALETA